ncbi:MAG: hypothetical protein VW268_11795 [Rhodospirillaceae bacterium]
MPKKKHTAGKKTYSAIFDFFDAPIVTMDCGKKCAPLNGGEPVCCDTQNAVPVMNRSEYKLLKSRTDMWRKFKPYDAATQKIVDELSADCRAVTCNGARHCERDNRSMSCRTFPFFPYFSKEGELLGLSYYWAFEDRCWVISNMAAVEKKFIDQFIQAYRILFAADQEELDVYIQYSASMRRVFSRWNRSIPVLDVNGGAFLVLPKGRGTRPVQPEKLPKHAPYKNA